MNRKYYLFHFLQSTEKKLGKISTQADTYSIDTVEDKWWKWENRIFFYYWLWMENIITFHYQMAQEKKLGKISTQADTDFEDTLEDTY